MSREGARLGERGEFAVEGEPTSAMRRGQPVEKHPAEQAREHAHGGRKKPGRQAIQRAPSGERLPGTMMCTCECWVMA